MPAATTFKKPIRFISALCELVVPKDGELTEEETQELLALIGHLDGNPYHAVYDHYVRGMGHREIGEEYSVSHTTAWQWCVHGIAVLSQNLLCHTTALAIGKRIIEREAQKPKKKPAPRDCTVRSNITQELHNALTTYAEDEHLSLSTAVSNLMELALGNLYG